MATLQMTPERALALVAEIDPLTTLDRHVQPEGDAFRRTLTTARLREERRRLEAKSITHPTPEAIARLITINNQLNELLTQTLTTLAGN